MRYAVTVKAIDIHGGVVSETSIPMVEMGSVGDILEEFTDRLERRGVDFSSILTDLQVQRPMTAVLVDRGIYRGLFPELSSLLA